MRWISSMLIKVVRNRSYHREIAINFFYFVSIRIHLIKGEIFNRFICAPVIRSIKFIWLENVSARKDLYY